MFWGLCCCPEYLTSFPSWISGIWRLFSLTHTSSFPSCLHFYWSSVVAKLYPSTYHCTVWCRLVFCIFHTLLLGGEIFEMYKNLSSLIRTRAWHISECMMVVTTKNPQQKCSFTTVIFSVSRVLVLSMGKSGAGVLRSFHRWTVFQLLLILSTTHLLVWKGLFPVFFNGKHKKTPKQTTPTPKQTKNHTTNTILYLITQNYIFTL